MTNWIHEGEWRAAFDDAKPWQRGKRASIWHSGPHELKIIDDKPYRWTVKDGYRKLACGNATTLGAAKAAVAAAVRRLGWPQPPPGVDP